MEDRTDTLLKAISGDGGDAVLVHQDAHVFVSHLTAGASVTHRAGRGTRRLPLRDRGRRLGERRARCRRAPPRRSSRSATIRIEAAGDSELILVDVSLLGS